jgi:hypothetical protein
MIPDQAVYMAACHFFLMFNRGDIEDPSPIPEFMADAEERGIRSAARFAWALRDEVERTNPTAGHDFKPPSVRTRLKPAPLEDEIRCDCLALTYREDGKPTICYRCGKVLA